MRTPMIDRSVLAAFIANALNGIHETAMLAEALAPDVERELEAAE
jgi:hypothetical protein